MCLFSMSASLFLLCKQVHLYHFSRFHVYALINSICFSFYSFNSLFKHVLGICPLSYLVSLSPPEQICLLLIAVHFISMLPCGFLCYSPSVFRLIHLFLSYRNFMSSLALWWLYSHSFCCRGFISTLLVSVWWWLKRERRWTQMPRWDVSHCCTFNWAFSVL